MHKGLPVAGYQAQGDSAIDEVNAIKEMEERILRVIDRLEGTEQHVVDKRFLAIGKTQLQIGFMAVVRSIFKPTRIELPEDDE